MINPAESHCGLQNIISTFIYCVCAFQNAEEVSYIYSGWRICSIGHLSAMMVPLPVKVCSKPSGTCMESSRSPTLCTCGRPPKTISRGKCVGQPSNRSSRNK